MSDEVLPRLFLELSQVIPDGTKTGRELKLEAENARLRERLHATACRIEEYLRPSVVSDQREFLEATLRDAQNALEESDE